MRWWAVRCSVPRVGVPRERSSTLSTFYVNERERRVRGTLATLICSIMKREDSLGKGSVVHGGDEGWLAQKGGSSR
jgi:hypothetical protein